ncbi:hypothetical protein [Chenggangzhangella methanolivorans]|uniref:Uncharacterized protein n=1 Tax=Chenggangzhangella methanolivorans TaxID=1437009 RepID=A0A9E6R7S4_9HYPH|nr:hypothetical protein [Chenggangzhangella methanolivorans]QZN98859.1 hypothetical protein K6K41_18300 [Chenggangzhangella methanolivorans]
MKIEATSLALRGRDHSELEHAGKPLARAREAVLQAVVVRQDLAAQASTFSPSGVSPTKRRLRCTS